MAKHCNLKPHMSSIFYDRSMHDYLLSAEYLIHGQISSVSGRNMVQHITMAPSIYMAMFCNQIEMLTETRIQCNGWMNFDCQYASHLNALHAKLNKLFSRWLEDWFVWSEEDRKIIEILMIILQEEDIIEKRIRSKIMNH